MSENLDSKAWYAEGDPWKLVRKGWNPDDFNYCESIFTQSNGYMGFRGYREEFDNASPTIREGYLGGVFADLTPVSRELVIHDYPWASRQMVALPEIFSAWILLDGEAFSLQKGEVVSYEQSLNMRNGVAERSVVWSCEGKTTRLKFTRFLSAANEHLAVQKVEIEPVDWSGSVKIVWDYDLSQKTVFRCGDPAKPHIANPHFAVREAVAAGNIVGGKVVTNGTRHEISFESRLLDAEVQSRASIGGLLSQAAEGRLEQGKVSEWVRTTTVETSRDAAPAPVVRGSYDELLAESDATWAQHWAQSDVEIAGSVHDQVLVRFGIFSLLQMAPFHADNLSVPARCYSYNRYNGLYFWDGEIFLLPYYQFCTPDVARNMLMFRVKTLDGARRNAELLGGKGAIFPWQGDADAGLEQAPWGLYEYLWHQSADIVYAFDQYARATGDAGFMFEHGLEVLAETARFWVSMLGHDSEGVYHIENAVGPDEAEQHGPDNGYTSLMVQRSLEISSHWWSRAQREGAAASEVAEGEVEQWKSIAAKICVPEVPGQSGVPLQDVFFLGKEERDISGMTVAEYWECRNDVQVIKQADIVLAMYLLEDRFNIGEIRRGYEFYEPKTLHVSSLSCNTHSMVAAIIGKEDEAYEYWRRAAGLDLDNNRNATKDGLHAAAMGGVWQMALNGFMGLRVREDHIYFQPALPEAWSEIRFPVQYRGWALRVTATATSFRVVVEGNGQPGAIMRVGDEQFELTKERVIEIEPLSHEEHEAAELVSL